MNITIPTTLPTANQAASFGRHIITFAMGAATLAGFLGLLSAGQTTDATHAVEQISSGFSSIIAGTTTLIGLGSALWAAWSASPFSQLVSVSKNPQVAQVIVNSPALADKLPANVVASK